MFGARACLPENACAYYIISGEVTIPSIFPLKALDLDGVCFKAKENSEDFQKITNEINKLFDRAEAEVLVLKSEAA